MSEIAALVIDYGGVLSSALHPTMTEAPDDDEVDPQLLRDVLREWSRSDDGGDPAAALERGEISVEEFERLLAPRLRTRGGQPVDAAGLLDRLFAKFARHEPMFEVVRQSREAGLRTALLSNSWGMGYDRLGWEALFDAVVISGEVGMRKPEPEIYRYTARQLGVAPRECVFVDDLGINVKGAVAVGMIGVKHVSIEQTVAELEAILGISFRTERG